MVSGDHDIAIAVCAGLALGSGLLGRLIARCGPARYKTVNKAGPRSETSHFVIMPNVAITRTSTSWTYILDVTCGAEILEERSRGVCLRRDCSLNQIELYRNFLFRRHLPIHKIFERSCALGVFRLTADQITQIFGVRKHKRIRGKLHGMLEKVDHGHHVLLVYCKSLVARLYEKVSTFPRVESESTG